MNERTMNEQIRPHDLVVFKSRRTDTTIEVFPDFFVYLSIPYVEMTEKGTSYLRMLHEMYVNDEVSVDDILRNFKKIADDFSGWESQVEDKLFAEFDKILN